MFLNLNINGRRGQSSHEKLNSFSLDYQINAHATKSSLYASVWFIQLPIVNFTIGLPYALQLQTGLTRLAMFAAEFGIPWKPNLVLMRFHARLLMVLQNEASFVQIP